MPGVTSWVLVGTICRTSATSRGEQTRPRNPAWLAMLVRRRTWRLTFGSRPSSTQRIAVQARQHRHAKDQGRSVAEPPGAFLRDLLGGFEHVRAAERVDGEHLDVQLHGGGHGLGNSVGDIVELQIKEHRRSHPAKPAHHVRPCAGKQLAAHFKTAGHWRERFGELQRRLGARHVEGHNDRIAHG